MTVLIWHFEQSKCFQDLHARIVPVWLVFYQHMLSPFWTWLGFYLSINSPVLDMFRVYLSKRRPELLEEYFGYKFFITALAASVPSRHSSEVWQGWSLRTQSSFCNFALNSSRALQHICTVHVLRLSWCSQQSISDSHVFLVWDSYIVLYDAQCLRINLNTQTNPSLEVD